MTFTHDELIQALQAATLSDDNADARTVAELAELSGLSKSKVLARLHELQASGNLEVVRRPYKRLDGTITRIPAYRWQDIQE